MAKVTGDKAPKTPQDNKKADKPADVIDIKTGAVADSDKPAKTTKKAAPKAAPKAVKPKKSKAKTEPTEQEIKDSINSARDESSTFVPAPIFLSTANAGKDPLGLKPLMEEIAVHEKSLKQVKNRHNDDIADLKSVLDDNKRPIQDKINAVYVRAAEKGVSKDMLNFLIKMNKPMTKAEYNRIQEERQLLLDVFNV